MSTAEKGQSEGRNREEGNKIRLILEILGVVILLSSVVINVLLWNQTRRSSDAAERSATAAEGSLQAAKTTADAAERTARVAEVALTTSVSQHFYLSRTPSYFDSKDKDDVWFLQPPAAIPIKQPTIQLMEK